jgi:hypothetical protein
LNALQILHLPLRHFINILIVSRNLLGIQILSKSLNSLISLIFLGSLISLSCGSTSGQFLHYQGNGFQFQYPATWTISESEGQMAGNLSIMDSCSRMNIIWTRDPGLAPESILDQIIKTYDQGEVEVASLNKGEISVQGKNAKTLDLLYKFKNYSAKKHFAVWISNESDRLFFASMSSCEEKQSHSIEMFNQILGTFKEGENREVSLEPRFIQDDVWAIILGDLLASYHYNDQVALKSMSIYAESVHSLTLDNGSYNLLSEDMIRTEMPDKIIIRAAALQNLLRNFDYDVRIIQKGGEIWILVLDPSNKWQAVSLNPTEPWRMIGVLTNKSEGYRGLMYKDIRELTDDNFPRANPPQNLDSYTQRDVNSSRYVQLVHPDHLNNSWADELQATLDNYSYYQKYQENIFDCSNASQICWALLEAKGYDARLMFSYKDHPLGQHMWVVVRSPLEEESYVAVEATNTNGNRDLMHLGKVTWDDEYYYGIMYNTSMQYSWLHPEEGMWLEA